MPWNKSQNACTCWCSLSNAALCKVTAAEITSPHYLESKKSKEEMSAHSLSRTFSCSFTCQIWWLKLVLHCTVTSTKNTHALLLYDVIQSALNNMHVSACWLTCQHHVWYLGRVKTLGASNDTWHVLHGHDFQTGIGFKRPHWFHATVVIWLPQKHCWPFFF